MNILKGDIYIADFTGGIGSEQAGVRPCVVISNNIGNKYSPCVIVAMLTSKMDKPVLPTHVFVPAPHFNLPKSSIILCEQIRTIDKKRLKTYIGTLNEEKTKELNAAICASLNI